MKKLLFIISFIAIAGTATAQHMVVETAGGNEVFTLENLKQITFNGTTVNIEQKQSIDNVGELGDNLIEYLSFDEIAINCEAGSMVAIYKY